MKMDKVVVGVVVSGDAAKLPCVFDVDKVTSLATASATTSYMTLCRRQRTQ
jgi:hypothetical protein